MLGQAAHMGTGGSAAASQGPSEHRAGAATA